MRWMSALLLCGCLALVAAVAFQSPQSLAMQNGTPTPPSAAARTFCPEAEDDQDDETTVFEPAEETVGVVPVRDIAHPYTPASSSGSLVMTFVTLPMDTCILGSAFYPSMLMTVTSGEVAIFVEHWPGGADAPVGTIVRVGDPFPQPITLDTATLVAAGDWVRIENESFVGFSNETDAPAEFVVAGLKPDGPPGGGGCNGGCRNRP